jgi:hypothetical protein
MDLSVVNFLARAVLSGTAAIQGNRWPINGRYAEAERNLMDGTICLSSIRHRHLR